MSYATGGESNSRALGSFYTNLANGDEAFAELDAVNAALDIGGGGGAAATMALGVFWAAGEAFGEGL